MTGYSTEEEQIEAFKAWWRKYGLALVMGVVIALLGSFSWRLWQQHRLQRLANASAAYEQMLSSVQSNKIKAALSEATFIKEHYPSSSYAQLAELLVARLAVQSSDYAKAQKALAFVMHHARGEVFLELARIRQARIALMMGDNKKAIELINEGPLNRHLPLGEAIQLRNKLPAFKIYPGLAYLSLGDAYMAQKHYEFASRSYKDAKKTLHDVPFMHRVLTMKINQAELMARRAKS